MWYNLCMKKVTCFINDSNLLEMVAAFCAAEKFQLEPLDSLEKFEYDVATILYITDNFDYASPDGIKDTPVCVITDDKAMCSCCHKILPRDFDGIHLRLLIDAVLHNGSFESCVASVTPISLSESYNIKNDIFNVERIIYTITKDFVYFLNFQALERVRVGLAEMLTNAIEHGNLNITGPEKLDATENGTYYDLIKERLSDERYAERQVFFSFTVSSEGMVMSMEDQGMGFDVNTLPDPTDPEGLLKLHGRGILITRMYFDEVSYNGKGNKVTLKKRF